MSDVRNHVRWQPFIMIMLAAALGACGSGDTGEGARSTEPGGDAATESGMPAEYQAGAEAFQTYCVECHGERASGTDQGPPLVHIYYEPNHHGDQAFRMAAEIGVRQHHWKFGNMPPVDGISEEEVEQVIQYVRYLQREAGIE